MSLDIAKIKNLISRLQKIECYRNSTLFMPFIDTGKLHKLNIAYGDNKEYKRNIDILTLKENRSKINEMLVKSTNIIEIDKCLDKVRNESMLCE